jgi:hypothetical protein
VSSNPARPLPAPSGRAEVVASTIDAHAKQFASDLSDRAAGSQGEQAASAYVLGHLQRAGYVVRLDAVPVENLVQSTNVVALPPSGSEPTAVVVVPYDSGSSNEGIGLFLELARAARTAEPDHSIEFVALGAEHDGGRGSEALAEELVADGLDPVVIDLSGVSSDGILHAWGEAEDDFYSVAGELSLSPTPLKLRPPRTVWETAGFGYLGIGGPAADAGRVLLALLAEL